MKRFLALVLAMAMLWSCVAQPVTALAAGTELLHGKNLQEVGQIKSGHQAMYFILRHWHSADTIEGLEHQMEELQSSGSYYFVVLEGYIIPNGEAYDFYLVDQGNKAKLTYLNDEAGRAFVERSPYVERIDPAEGRIVLLSNAVTNSKGTMTEEFSGYSISAGHSAMEEKLGEDDHGMKTGSLTITYDPYVHLSKAHAFYIAELVDEDGNSDPKIFGGSEAVADGNEEDTAWAFVYRRVIGSSGHEIGGVVKDQEGNVITDPDFILDQIVPSGEVVEWSKVYNTNPGLHTDKTATIHTETAGLNDGRTFDLDLEAWYVEGILPQVGMVLDASGSMAFTSQTLGAITIEDAETEDAELLAAMRAKIDGINKEKARLESGNTRASTSAYVYPKREKMVGYYEFNKDIGNHPDDTTGRDWLLNSVSAGRYASKLENQASYAGDGSLSFVESEVDTSIGWPDAHSDLQMNADNGFLIDGENGGKQSSGGFVLDLNGETLGADFTVSFTIRKNSGNKGNPGEDANGAPKQTLADIMYIGAMNASDENYFRVVRSGNNAQYAGGDTWRAWLSGYQGKPVAGASEGASNLISSASAFHNSEKHTVTYVFKDVGTAGATVTTYMDGVADLDITDNSVDAADAQSKSVSLPNPADIKIIFNGIEEDPDYNGAYLFVDDIVVYNTALDASEVGTMVALIRNGVGINEQTAQSAGSAAFDWNNIFLTDAEVATLLDSRMTDNGQLSVSGYSYFVYDARENTAEYTPLSYWEGPANPDAADSLVGYYSFGKQDDWFKNGVTGKKDAELIVQSWTMTPTFSESAGFQDVPTAWKGILSTANGFKLNQSQNGLHELALKLGVKPSGDEFTVSFTVKQDKGTEVANGTAGDGGGNTQNAAEILYVGSGDSGNYYRAYRDARTYNGSSYSNNSARLRATDSSGIKVTDINAVFGNQGNGSTTNIVTLVFKDGKVTSYLNGSVGDQGNGTGANTEQPCAFDDPRDISIIFNALMDQYNGGDLYIDKIYVFDSALDGDAVSGLYTHASSNAALSELKLTTEGAIKVAKTLEENPRTIGTINFDIDSSSTNFHHRGWYYLTHSGNWAEDYIGNGRRTGKRLIGLAGAWSFEDKVTLPGNSSVTSEGDTNVVYSPGRDIPIRFYFDSKGNLRCFFGTNSSNTFASYVYKLEDNEYVKTESLQRALGAFITRLAEISPRSAISATRFSTDKASGDWPLLVMLDWTSNPGESATLMNLSRDDENIADAPTGSYTTSVTNGVKQYNYGLTGSTSTQQGLRAFIDHLLPNDGDKTHKYLIVFTDGKDTDLLANTLGYGDGQNITFQDYNKNDPYNNAYTAALRKRIYAGGSYLDNQGRERTAAQHPAIDLVRRLKLEGYTVFAVMLAGGSVVPGGEAYEQAHIFLRELAGNMETDGLTSTTTAGDLKTGYKGMKLAEKEEYFFSTDKAMSSPLYDPDMQDEDVLTMIFSEEILNKITSTLSGYTVKDYIDPRFDLVHWANNKPSVWHLNAGGEVCDDKGNLLFTATADSNNKISLYKDACEDKADTPYLRYDDARDMYYLEWEKQTIPGTVEDSTELAVWNARVTVRAKDDFIGGNAVMTNGNAEKMNYLYHPDDSSPSSGTSEARRELEKHPSKGFPRTVVNVKPSSTYLIGDELIYMGETVSKAEAAKRLVEAAEANQTSVRDPLAQYYWEYLLRYAKYYGEDLDALIEKIASGEGLSIPYSYIPNRAGTNQTGNTTVNGVELHHADYIGRLDYKLLPLEELDWATDAAIIKSFGVGADITEADYLRMHPETSQETKDRLTRMSKLVVTFYPQGLESDAEQAALTPPAPESLAYRMEANAALVSEDAYQWNSKYKPVDPDQGGNVGELIGHGVYLIEGFFITRIVSGEVTLQVEVADSKALAGETITYVADLVRTDPSGKETVVGQLKLEGATISGQKKLYNAVFTPAEAYMGYHMDERDEYGLPIGVYTLKTVTELCQAPIGYFFEDVALILAPDQYGSPLFTKGTQFTAAGLYIASPDAARTAFILGDKAAAARNTKYTDFRFGLFRVPLVSTERGVLTVSKFVTGKAGDQTKAFDFMVMLSNTAVNGTYGEMTFSGGVATFTLKHGESKTATGLPVGMKYSVSEPNAAKDGYVVTATGDNGVISANAKAKATFINNMETVDVPQTGDETNLILWAVLLVLSALGIGLCFRKGRNKKD